MIYKCIFGFACTWLKKYFSMHMNHLLFCVTVKIKPHTSEFHQCISDAQIFLALIFFHWKFNNYVFKMIWNCDYFYIGEYAFTHWFWSVHFRMCRFLPHSKITCRHSDVLHFLSCLLTAFQNPQWCSLGHATEKCIHMARPELLCY